MAESLRIFSQMDYLLLGPSSVEGRRLVVVAQVPLRARTLLQPTGQGVGASGGDTR